MKTHSTTRRLLWTGICALVVAGPACSSDPEPNDDAGTTNPDGGTPDSGVLTDGSIPVPGCGDGVLSTDEACEGFELRGETCLSQGFNAGQLRCTASCTLDTSACAQCGNNTVETGEICDGTDVAGATCADLLGAGYTGSVECAEDCLGHITDACTLDLPQPELAPCDTSSASAAQCAGGLDCVTTGQGDFCVDTCDPNTAGDCGTSDVCIDIGPARAPAFACVQRPSLGDSCTADTGCESGTCEEVFSSAQGTSNVCVSACSVGSGEDGTGDCASGYSCTVNPAGFYEEEAPGPITCTEATVSRDCDVDAGYECLQVGMDATGGPLLHCARYARHCAVPQDFFGFDTTRVPEEARCDLAGPTDGGRYCGLLGSILSGPAHVRCFPIFDGIDSVGACVGFCDPSLSADGRTDLECGTGGSCVVPTEPQFFFPQVPSVSCTAGISACDQGGGWNRCLDLGNGLECARPSKVCAPTGG